MSDRIIVVTRASFTELGEYNALPMVFRRLASVTDRDLDDFVRECVKLALADTVPHEYGDLDDVEYVLDTLLDLRPDGY